MEGEALTEKRGVADWSGVLLSVWDAREAEACREAEGTAVTAGELLALREACGEPDWEADVQSLLLIESEELGDGDAEFDRVAVKEGRVDSVAPPAGGLDEARALSEGAQLLLVGVNPDADSVGVSDSVELAVAQFVGKIV